MTIQNDIPKKFAVKGLLGEGTYGRVYKVQDKKTGQLFAVKYANDKEDADYERKMLSKFQEPFIVKMFPEYSKRKLIFLELAQSSLKDVIDFHGVRFRIDNIKKVMIALLSAVELLHSEGYAHLDIKPRNILQIDGYIKLADFGSVHKIGAGECRRITTIEYSPPELLIEIDCLSGDPESAAVDMWSLGITMMSMLIGRSVFDRYGGSHISALESESGQYSDMTIVRQMARFGNPFLIEYPDQKLMKSFVKLFRKNVDDNSIEFVAPFICWHPTDRITAEKALKDGYLDT